MPDSVKSPIQWLSLLVVTALMMPSAQAAVSAQKPLKPDMELANAIPKQAQSTEQAGFREGVLKEGSPTFSNTGRRFNSYGFEGKANTTIEIIVTSKDFNPVVSLLDLASDTVIARETGTAGKVKIRQKLSRDGSYAFRVTATDVPGEGRYQFQVVTIREMEGQEAEAIRLLNQAAQQYHKKQIQAAIASSQQALRLSQKMGDLELQMEAFNLLGIAYYQSNQPQQVIQLLDSGSAVIRQLGSVARKRSGQKGVESSFLGTVGLAYADLQNYERAAELHQQALEIARRVGDRTQAARALNNLGVAYGKQGKNQDALRAYEQSLAIAEELKDGERQVNALANIANVHRLSKAHRQAIQFYKRAIALDQEIGGSQVFKLTFLLAESYENLASDSIAQGDYQQALTSLQQAQTLVAEFGEAASESASLLNLLGISYRNLGHYQQALEVFQQALERLRKSPDPGMEANVLGNLGNVYQQLGQPHRGLEHHQAALKIAQVLNDPLLESSMLGNLGSSYANLGNYQEAIKLYERRLERARQQQDQKGILYALNNLMAIKHSQGTHVLGHQQEALEIARKIDNPLLLANTLVIIANSNFFIKHDGDKIVVQTSLHKPLDIAWDYYKEALAIYQSAGAIADKASVLVHIGQAYLRNGQPEMAEDHLREAVRRLDTIRQNVLDDSHRISLFQTQLKAFSLLQQALVDQGKAETGLEIAEQGRARALVELLSQRRFNVESAKLSSTTPDLRAIKQIAQQTNTTLVTYSLIRQVDRNYEMNRLFGWANVGYRFDQFLYIWVVAPDGNITFRQVPVTQVNLAELVSETRQAMGVRGSRSDVDIKVSSNLPQRRTETEARLAQLHKILIAPIADLLPTDPKQTVAFIPQGELFLVPFAALKAPNGSYLIENHTIVTAPSIQVLQLTHKLAKQRNRPARFQAKNPLIVGNPTMPRVPLRSAVGTFQSVQLDPLFGAQREAKRVADFLGTSALIGEQATEARVKQQMGSADVIHLATHGLLEYGDPRETGTLDVPGAIALTPGKGEDGLLTTAEILQMNLQANLVVLSACDTGRGRVTGDGVIGLSRAFVAAGVPSIVVSLWKVPDDSTAFLMTEFYKNLQKFPDKAQALRQAMLTARANYTDPLHWAAFTLIGEAR